nr:MRE11 [Acutuncus antarcticus]
MKRPSEATDDWFNIFVLHQNRPAGRGTHNYIPETFLEEWLDLVIWGHEHDPIPKPVLNREKGFEVLQPGSSVATSMSDGEGKQKFCYLLKVCGRRYRVEPIPLTTVRPFYIEEINLEAAGYMKDEGNSDSVRAEVEKFLCKKMERIISKAERDRGQHQPKEPLVRLRIDFGNVEPLNPILFGQKFFGRVANPKDIILPMKVKPMVREHHGQARTNEELKPLIVLDTTTIEDLVVDHFEKKGDDHLQFFDPKFLTESLRQYVHNVSIGL